MPSRLQPPNASSDGASASRPSDAPKPHRRRVGRQAAREEAAAPPSGQPRRVDVVGLGESMLTLRRSSHGQTFDWEIAGAESNTVRYCAAHGLSTAWVSQLGTDLAGDLVMEAIAADGVDVSGVTRHAERPTGIMLKEQSATGEHVHYYRAGSAAAAMAPASVDIIGLRSAHVLHLSGITPALSDSCRDLTEALLSAPRDETALISFDVNWRPTLHRAGTTAGDGFSTPFAGTPGEADDNDATAVSRTEATRYAPSRADDAAEMLLWAANRSDVVFVGMDEAEEAWNASTPRRVRALVPDPAMVVVKDSERGAHAFSANGAVFVPALRGPIVGTVGAGDAFAAGVLSGMLREPGRIDAWLRRGHITAMCALGHPSDVGPLAEPATIEDLLSLSPSEWERARLTCEAPPL